jgi:hypothetical protein
MHIICLERDKCGSEQSCIFDNYYKNSPYYKKQRQDCLSLNNTSCMICKGFTRKYVRSLDEDC